MKKRISLFPFIAIAYMIVLLSGCVIGLQRLPGTVEEQLQDAVDDGMDGIIVCVNRPGDIQLYAAGWHDR